MKNKECESEGDEAVNVGARRKGSKREEERTWAGTVRIR